MREVPLAFPLAAADSSSGCTTRSRTRTTDCCRCYTLAADESTLVLNDVNRHGHNNNNTVPRYRDQNNHVSSVSEIGNGIIVTVAPAAGESCLSVTILQAKTNTNNNNVNEPIVTLLDFHTVAPMIPLYATKAYPVVDEHVHVHVSSDTNATLFQLMIVTASPTVYTLWFDLQTGTPQPVPGTTSSAVVRTTHIRRALSATTTTTTTASSSLHPNRVGFLGPDRILVALQEELIAYDLQSNDFDYWSEITTTTLASTTASASAATSRSASYFAAMAAVVVPPLASLSAYRISDRQPIAALHVLDEHYVFCVHADGSLHQWTLANNNTPSSSLHPVSYRALSSAHNHMPPCDTWDSIVLTAAQYPNSRCWCWIVYVHCTTPIAYTDTACTPVALTQTNKQTNTTHDASPHVVLAITGSTEEEDATRAVTTLRLVTPPWQEEQEPVVLTHLLLTTPACSLITAATTTTTNSGTTATEWWTYPQGVASSLLQLDAVASTAGFLEQQHDDDDTAVHQQYRVLRPTGTGLPPRSAVIQAARGHLRTTNVRRRNHGTPPPHSNNMLVDEQPDETPTDAMIAAAEATERSVVALGMVQPQTVVVVRPCSTAVLVPQQLYRHGHRRHRRQQQRQQPLLSPEQQLIHEFDRVALAKAAEFAEELQVLQDTVWTIVSQGRLVLDAATIETCKHHVFATFRHEHTVELPSPVARTIAKQYYTFQKALAVLPFEWYTGFLGEPGDDSRATASTTTPTTTTTPLGFHGRLAASSCTIRVLENACHLFLARSLILSAVSKHGHEENLHIYLSAVSMLHMATTTTTTPTTTALVSSPSSNDNQSHAAAATSHLTFLDTFLAHQSSTTQETFHGPSSYAGRTLYWTRRSFLSLLGMTVDPSDPVFSLLAPNGTIPDPSLALCCLAPHVTCLANTGNKDTHKENDDDDDDDPTALLTARCLLRVAAAPTTAATTAHAMAERAFSLLTTSTNDRSSGFGEKYIDKLLVLESEFDASNRVVAQTFFALTKKLSAQWSGGSGAEAFHKLWTASFRAAVKTGEFADALLNCKRHPDLVTRYSMVKELVVSMLHQGALDRLCEFCVGRSSDKDFCLGTNMYGIAEVTIQELIADSGDFYTASVLSSSSPDARPLHDYSMDLQCIHVKAGQWKKVASCWHDRYNQAVQALSAQDPMVLSPIQKEEREGLIVSDLARAAYTVKMAMLQLDPLERLLVDYANQDRWTPVQANLVRQTSSRGSTSKKSGPRHDVRWNMVGLELRFQRASGLKLLWKFDSSFATEAFQSDDISDAQVLDRLCMHGLYANALRLGIATDKVRPGELNQLLCHLCVKYLVPLMTPKAKKPDIVPSLDQIAESVQYLRRTFLKENTDMCDNFSIARQGGRSRRTSSDLIMIQTATEVLVQTLLRAFGSSTRRFHHDMAMALLITHKYHCLPAWYESFLLLGTVPDARLPGLFARRRAPDTPADAFLGHPDGLLSIYLRSHRYADAARIVCTVLQGADISTKRLPEQGGIDWIPGPAIRVLWEKLEGVLLHHKHDNHGVDSKHIARIQQARDDLKLALEHYSDLVQRRKEGLLAERTLSR